MSRNDRRHGRNNNWNNNQKKNNQKDTANQKQKEQKHYPVHKISPQEIAEKENAIREFKARSSVCEICNQPIQEMASAMANRGSGNPVHFDCALEMLGEEETLAAGDKITYIGQGRFGVLNFPNVHDMRHFTIKKIIDWEEKDKKPEWRDQMADLFSHVK